MLKMLACSRFGSTSRMFAPFHSLTSLLSSKKKIDIYLSHIGDYIEFKVYLSFNAINRRGFKHAFSLLFLCFSLSLHLIENVYAVKKST